MLKPWTEGEPEDWEAVDIEDVRGKKPNPPETAVRPSEIGAVMGPPSLLLLSP